MPAFRYDGAIDRSLAAKMERVEARYAGRTPNAFTNLLVPTCRLPLCRLRVVCGEATILRSSLW